MSFVNTILEKLGLGGKASTAPASATVAAPAPSAPKPTTNVGAAPAGGASRPATAPSPPPAPPPPRPVSTVDVAAQLEKLAAANPQKLNWRTSIVDLLKLLDIDSSFTARKALATELNCPAELMGDSAKMNVWLHKAVLSRIAANGGKVPQDLLS
jgi:hypothetical protein